MKVRGPGLYVGYADHKQFIWSAAHLCIQASAKNRASISHPTNPTQNTVTLFAARTRGHCSCLTSPALASYICACTRARPLLVLRGVYCGPGTFLLYALLGHIGSPATPTRLYASAVHVERVSYGGCSMPQPPRPGLSDWCSLSCFPPLAGTCVRPGLPTRIHNPGPSSPMCAGSGSSDVHGSSCIRLKKKSTGNTQKIKPTSKRALYGRNCAYLCYI